jgi:hypothetical protein
MMLFEGCPRGVYEMLLKAIDGMKLYVVTG